MSKKIIISSFILIAIIGILGAIAYSSKILNPFVGNSGEIMKMNLNVSEEMEEGIYAIKVENIILSGLNDDAYYAPKASAQIEVYRYDTGDANGDKMVDITDVVSIINAVMGNTSDNFQFKVADINGDNQINVLDVVAIAKIILNQPAPTSTSSPMAMSVKTSNALTINNVSIQPGETQTVAVSLENVNDFTGFQMDLSLPEGLRLVGQSLTNRGTVSHTLNAQRGENGITRLLSYSPMLSTYKSHSGALLTLELSADEQFNGGGLIEIGNIIFADKNSQGYRLNTVRATIGSPSYIESIMTSTEIYEEDGRLVIVSPVATEAIITTLSGITMVVDLAIGENQIDLPQGFYVVKVNTLTEKVIIKE